MAQLNQRKIGLLQESEKKYVSQGCRKVKKFGGASSKGWAESAPLVEIGLTDLPKMGGGPPHLVPASLYLIEICSPIYL